MKPSRQLFEKQLVSNATGTESWDENEVGSLFLFQYYGKEGDSIYCRATCLVCEWENVYSFRKEAIDEAFEHRKLEEPEMYKNMDETLYCRCNWPYL